MEGYLNRIPEMVEQIRAVRDTIITNILLIGQTPAPTFREKRRTSVFMDRLAEFQVDEVTTDGYRNPIGVIHGTSAEKPPIFVVAHLDTFFNKDIVYNYSVGENTITGPGLMDNTVGVGVLVSLPFLFQCLGLRFESDIVLAGVIQSIGKGNLRGIRHLLKTWEGPIRGGVCIEGGELGRLNYFSDGMIRAEIECSISRSTGVTHKFLPNSILVLNEIINEILKLRLPQRPRSRIVIGKISGGVDHGAVAYEATMGLEIRSHSDRIVKDIYKDIQEIVDGISHEDQVDLKLSTISNLNATRLRYNDPLVKHSAAVLRALGIEPVSDPTESALSILLSHNIPSVTLGVTHGYNYYEEDATMEIEPMYKGIAQIIGVITAIDSGVCDE
ncbi:MAG: peptidase dimerization domain-containing protein [Desulfobacterales bacterium]|nr:peptidase dimerization domain-containing protein [Desulfobacterales bacterium]